MEKMALEGEKKEKALGCLNEVRSIMCHNYTTWQMSSYWEGCFHPIEKKLALRVSEAPPYTHTQTHTHPALPPSTRFLSHQWANKRPFALSPEADWKRKVARSNAAFSCLLWSTKCVCAWRVCTCACSHSHAILCISPSLSLSLCLYLCIFPSHTHTHTNR